jgi:hypothetical protein
MLPLRLLDVEALRSVLVKGSVFDSNYIRRLEHAKFLASLSHRIIMPVMPSDEAFDYLATQAIADYLASEVQLDGIIYPSVQSHEGKRNVVLFHKAARVESLQLPKDTDLTARLSESTDEGYEVDYSVWEEVPPEKASGAEPDVQNLPHLPSFAERLPEDDDTRETTLRLDTKEIKVHHVQAVSFTSEIYSVSRHRFEKRDHLEF